MTDAMAAFEGTVSPSYHSSNTSGGFPDLLQKLPVRTGRVIRVHSPSSESSRSRRYIEYDVLVDTSSEHGPPTQFVIPHCMVASVFGGIADHSFWTPRATTDGRKPENYGTGSTVVVVLVDASAFGGLIIGGLQRQAEVPDSTKHQAMLEFNGVRCHVNNEGEFRITFQGATDALGEPLNPTGPTGTQLLMDAEGNFKMFAPEDIVGQAEGSINLFAAFNMNLNADNTIQTDSQFVKLGAATDQMVLGTTYRAAEAIMNSSLQAAHSANLVAWASLIAFLSSPGLLLAVNSFDPSLATAGLLGGAIVAAGTVVSAESAATTAISSFEAAAANYLSNKNFLDK
jgi:hypothetical protein